MVSVRTGEFDEPDAEMDGISRLLRSNRKH